jgi:NAD-dependent dihydropyrimidine dehydrogenase PreA subunit
MKVQTMRKIVRIDEDKCNGCGACAHACAEGALQIIDGKARLISEQYCDGLGACLGECPQGAIIIEERAADEFDEMATAHHLEEKQTSAPLPCGCPSAQVTQFGNNPVKEDTHKEIMHHESALRHWPMQLTLVPPTAPFLQGADVLLTADCVPFSYAGFHRDLLPGHALLIACPKLDDFPAHLKKLTDILRQAKVKSLTVVHMEVPCCSGLVHMARQAIQASGQNIPLREITVSIRGELI